MKWFKILWKNIFRHCKLLLPFMILSCSVYAFTIVPINVQKIYVDNLYEYINGRYDIVQLILWLVLYYVVRSFSGGILIPFAGFKDIYFDYSVKKTVYQSQHDINNSVPLEVYDTDSIYSMMERSGHILTSGSLKSTINAITAFFTLVISMVSMLISLYSIHSMLLSLAIIMVIPMFVEYFWFFKRNSIMEKELVTIRRKQAFYMEHICSVNFISQTQIAGATKYFINQWKKCVEQIEQMQIHIAKRKLAFGLFSNFVKSISIVGIISYSIYLLAIDNISIGSFSFVLGIIGLLLSYMDFLIRTLSQSIISIGELKEVSEYYCLEKESSLLPINNVIGDIRLDGVFFKYANSNCFSLQNITCSFKKGEKIAIVGINGAGKTTLANIIMGLYSPTHGNVYYDETNVLAYNKSLWQERMTAIFQDYSIYNVSIADNVFIGNIRSGKDDIEIIEALEKAEFSHEFASKDSLIGREFGGIELSVGEKQKIASARAYYNKMAEVMVIDEPTSALDPIAEQKLYKSLIDNSKDKTLFIITHRLSSVKIADRIIVMDSSQIVEEGTHDELLKKNGIYSSMYKKQAGLYDR